MSTLNDDDILLVERGGVQYKVEAQYVSTGPNGVILPSVEVLTPLNGAGLNEGDAYTPLSSAYVSTDSTPIYNRYFPQTFTTVSGGTWTDENNIFDSSSLTYGVLSGAAYVVSQTVFTNIPALSLTGEAEVGAYASGGGTIEVIDENDVVLRTYTLPSTDTRTAVGIVRVNNKIRYTTTNTNTSLYVGLIQIGGTFKTDYVISGRVAFEFTDDTDLDKMVAPIIQVDENGNVKVPTTSTVDSTTTIPGEHKILQSSWTGTASTQSFINSDIYPLNSRPPGGPRMVWGKADDTGSGYIADNVANVGYFLRTAESDQAKSDYPPQLNENESIYTTGSGQINVQGYSNYIAEIGVAPKVLDIVTWTGDNSSLRAIPHNLGCKPGMIIIKRKEANGNWVVWHKDLTPGEDLYLNTNRGETVSHVFASEPTSDAFYIEYNGFDANVIGGEYVAYVFAADTAGKIKCGTYNGNGSSQNISTGMSGGFVLVKRRNGNNNWVAVTDDMTNYGGHRYWEVNTSAGLAGGSPSFSTAGSGFYLYDANSDYNGTNSPYIYLCVSRDLTGPASTQLNLLNGQDLEYFTTGTQITSNAAASGSNISFGSVYQAGDNQFAKAVNPTVGGQYFFDTQSSTGNKWLIWAKSTTANNSHRLYDSERNTKKHLYTNMGNGEFYDAQGILDEYTTYYGYYVGNNNDLNNGGDNYIYWNFLAAPQFFDIQKYVGTGSVRTIQHDLGVEPGCMIIKRLDSSNDWRVYHSELTSAAYQLYLNYNFKEDFAPPVFNSTDPTSSAFTVGPDSGVNGSGGSYIAYIFAKDTPYVKCGSYTGTGTNMFVDIGFKPRWIMIKNTSDSDRWVVHDKTSPNKYLSPNEDNAERQLYFEFVNNGININNAGAPNNTNGNTYIYIAIADESEGHPPSAPSTSTVTETPDPASATMVVNAESFDVGATASAAALEASITSVGGSEGNSLFVDSSTGTWVPGLYAKGTETTIDAPGPDEITFTSQNQGTPAFSGVDATLASRTWTLESSTTATGPWTVVDSYVDYDVLNSQDGATPWTSNKPNLAPNTFYRVKVQYNSTNAESVESVYHTFKTGDA